MRRVVIMQGIPGSGKSHYAASLGGMVVSADNHFLDVEGVYRFNPSELPLAHGACFRTFIGLLEVNAPLVVVDNTNTTPTEIAPYILGAQGWGYDPEIIRIDCDPHVAAARNTHGVPVSAVLAMHDRLQVCQLMPWWNVTRIAAWMP